MASSAEEFPKFAEHANLLFILQKLILCTQRNTHCTQVNVNCLKCSLSDTKLVSFHDSKSVISTERSY